MKKLLALLLLGTAACGDNLAPLMSPLTDQHAVVGVELLLSVRGTDPEGDALTFSFASDADIAERARLEQDGDAALLRFTPMASDVGIHTFEISVSDGTHRVTETVAVEVTLTDGGGTAPVFVQPLGTGTTLDLKRHECVTFPIVVEDSDSADVAITLDAAVEGASLQQLGARQATFRWCPSAAQIADNDRYSIGLSADDADNDAVAKDYLIVLQGGLDESCEGAAPSVQHLPKDELSSEAHVVRAHISDDLGLKHEPLLYYTFENPGDDPDLGSMVQVTMTLADGDDAEGEWTASIPNPVANAAPGTTQMAYYVIVAQDADADGCSHYTRDPHVGAFRMQFERPDDGPPAPMCVDDSQEEDDSAAQARVVDLDLGTYDSNDNAICSLDDDWYEVFMYAGETLHATLAFTQSSADEDIDILIYQAGANLSGCSENEPWLCDSQNGQSGTSNERLAWPIATTGVYHLVVRGWDGSENDYDICVGLSSAACP